MTGKNKEKFEAFLFNNIYSENEYHNKEDALCHYDNLKHEMQVGVIIAYYESLDLVISIGVNLSYTCPFCWELIYDYNYQSTINYPSRKEATLAAFKEADKLIKKQL